VRLTGTDEQDVECGARVVALDVRGEHTRLRHRRFRDERAEPHEGVVATSA
jgi:hypothetical protein